MADKEPSDDGERFLSKNLTLDLAGLNAAQREEGSIFLGGRAAEFVTSDDKFDYEKIATVVFNWGDPGAEEVFAILIEHIEAPSEQLLAFSPVAVIDDQIWHLALQDKGWRPNTAYEFDSDYIEVPFTTKYDNKTLQEAFSQMRPGGKQVIGKVGSRYVLFEMGTDVGPSAGVETIETTLSSALPERSEKTDTVEETISREKALEFLEKFIDFVDFEQMDDQERHFFTLHIVYWVAETFGYKDRVGNCRIYPDRGNEIKGEILPETLRNLLMQAWKDEIHFSGENLISLSTKHVGIETDPIIPRWEEVEGLPTYREQQAFVKANQDIIDGIIPSRVEVMPQVRMLFTPGAWNGWELEITANQLGITVLPSGDRGKTKAALDFVLATINKPALLAKITCQLAYLAAKYADGDIRRATQTLPKDVEDKLFRRLKGEKGIELTMPDPKDIESNPGNAIKNLLIRFLNKSETE